MQPPRNECLMRRLLVAVLVVHVMMVAWSATKHSPGVDEPAHLAAGLSYWHLGRFDLYRVNPPLVELLATSPLLVLKPKLDWGSYDDSPGTRSEFEVGLDFVYTNRDKFMSYLIVARWACIPFTVIGGIFVFRWGNELFGPQAGFLATCLWCFSPAVLGNAPMVTADVPSAAMGVAASFYFWRWTNRRTLRSACFVGLVFGFALLTKSTWIVNVVIWPLLSIWNWFKSGEKNNRLQDVLQIGAIMTVAVYVLNLGYCFEGSMQYLGDYKFVSDALKGPDAYARYSFDNRFRDGLLHWLPLPFPSSFVRGIDEQKRDFELGNWSYALGQWQERGWWWYYLLAASVKLPTGVLCLAAFSVVSVLRRHTHLELNSAMHLASTPLLLFVLASANAGLSRYYRYLLPLLPFLFVLAAGGIASSSIRTRLLAKVFAFWAIASSVWYFPHSMSYFNELAGGPRNGHKVLVDANIDWGQDLLYLRDKLRALGVEDCQIAFFGVLIPQDVGMSTDLPPIAEPDTRFVTLEPGWYAVSVNFVQGYPYPAAGADEYLRGIPLNGLAYFQQLTPVDSAAFSINIYKVESRLEIPIILPVRSGSSTH